MTTKKREGYLKIGNKTIDDLIDSKNVSNKMRVYFLVVRMINGWNNEVLEIPVSTFAKRLGVGERYVKRILKKLKEENFIRRNGSITIIPGDYEQWWWSGKNLPPPGGGQVLQKEWSKVTPKRVVKKDTLNTPILQPNNPCVLATPLSREEVEKLEGLEWFRAAMIYIGGFEKEYVEKLIRNNDFHKLMDCWYIYIEAKNIRNKEGFFIKLLEKYHEEE